MTMADKVTLDAALKVAETLNEAAMLLAITQSGPGRAMGSAPWR